MPERAKSPRAFSFSSSLPPKSRRHPLGGGSNFGAATPEGQQRFAPAAHVGAFFRTMRRYPEGKIKAQENWISERYREAVVSSDPDMGNPISLPIQVWENPNAEVFSLIRPDTQDRAKAYFGEDGKREI